jgi:hypothetical protein
LVEQDLHRLDPEFTYGISCFRMTGAFLNLSQEIKNG